MVSFEKAELKRPKFQNAHKAKNSLVRKYVRNIFILSHLETIIGKLSARKVTFALYFLKAKRKFSILKIRLLFFSII